MTDLVNPFTVLDVTGSEEEFTEAVYELMQQEVFNFVGSEADWLRMQAAIKVAMERESAGWDQAAQERNTDA